MIFKSTSEKQTKEIAHKISSELDSFNVICLYGEMGAGKTTFTKALAQSLGVKNRVISPTYIFVRTYKGNNKKIYHIDAYRFNSESSIDEIKEILEDNNAIIIIEWAEKIKRILPKKRIDIDFLYKNENEREIRVKKHFG